MKHEAVNGKMKEFAILGSVYRGNRDHHHMVFEAVDCIVQREIMSGRATFDVSYYVVRLEILTSSREGSWLWEQ